MEDDSNQIKDPNWRHPVNSKKSLNTSDFYPCIDHCQKKFKTERALLRHQESEISCKLNCEKCGRKFRNEIIWQTHQDKCNGTKNEDQKGLKIRRKRLGPSSKSSPKTKKIKTEIENTTPTDNKEVTNSDRGKSLLESWVITFRILGYHFC